MTLKSLESKTIVFEVSEEIVKEKNVKKFFGENSIKVSDISCFAKLIVFELKLFSFFSPCYWLKPKSRIRRKNIKRYVVSHEAVNWDHSINLISQMIKRIEKH